MRPSLNLSLGVLLAAAHTAAAQQAPGRSPIETAPSPAVARSIEAVEARFEKALAERDRATLETMVAAPFTWVHASDGRMESREVWLAAAARGMALTGQRTARTAHAPTLSTYGGTPPGAVLWIARVQLVDTVQHRETWLRQSQLFVRGDDSAWLIAAGQGTLMYEGPPLDATLPPRYAGTYVLGDGRVLTLVVEDGALFATLPNGSRSQIFLGSPTDEVVRTTGAGRLRFTLDGAGNPLTAALVRGETEVWRAVRRP